MLVALLIFALAAAAMGYVLGWLADTPHTGDQQAALVDTVNALLPQTQCAQCGYPGCRPYAEAIINGVAAINRCPPGGDQTIIALAELLGREFQPLDATVYAEKPPLVARIVEAHCIGCTLCIDACPVDAIAGAAKLMHTVIAADCTGCELCLPPCPVDCIELEPVVDNWSGWSWPKPA
ncbi:MAG: electron transport complex subunit RsxB [Granulosicoccus sp.]